MARQAIATETLKYVLGTCMPSAKQTAAKIRIRRLVLDKNILMYFPEYEFVYAADPEKRCKTGDIVLIQNLQKKMTRLITHKVIDVIYPLGDVTDPITGEKVAHNEYRQEMKEISKLIGPCSTAFDYDTAPERGSLEGIRDFTDKETYIKYQDDPNQPDDPYAYHK